ncbi:hypothetical protein BJY01DRAFT_244692 [Aspergillus pseudoustus]|uniref:F-box domain-containing protein n=1 Tax=Aspergillus pseudoustus TaxID=1810923 RepID=A0ABR4KIH0_9EURO
MCTQLFAADLRRLMRQLRIGSHGKHESRLLRLPVEILQQIFSYLKPSSLVRICLVCHQLRCIATPSLFRTVTLDSDQGFGFMVAITRKPEHALYVHSMTIHDHSSHIPDYHEIYTGYATFLEDAILRCTNLRNLTIKASNIRDTLPDYTSDHEFELTAREDSFQRIFLSPLQPSCLASLEICELNLSDAEGWNLAEREGIFFHPRLKRLSILGAIIPDIASFDKSHKHTSPLEELSLMGCDISPKALEKIALVPKRLRHFTFIAQPQGMYGSKENTSVRHKLYFKCLLPQAASLEFLNVSIWKRLHSDNPPIDFRPFSALQHLTIQPGILQGNGEDFYNLTQFSFNPLPASLKHLTLFDVRLIFLPRMEESYVGSLAQWIAEGSLPNFASLTFANPLDRPEELKLPSGWEESFQGKVVVKREQFVKLRRFPIDCDCCEYNMGSWELRF